MSNAASEEFIAELRHAYPEAAVSDLDNGSTRILIEYHLNAGHEGVPLAEDFGLEILLTRDYPNAIPLVRETTHIIPDEYEHYYIDKWFCLGVSYELAEGLAENPSLTSFLDGPVRSYLYTALFHTRYGRYPYGDRPHGAAGILQSYSERFGTREIADTVGLMMEIARGKYHGSLPCPCGSGKAARSCHGETMRKLMKEPVRNAVCSDLQYVLDQLTRKRKRQEALSLVDARAALRTSLA